MKRDVYQETWKKIKHHSDERTESKNAGPLTARFPSAVILKNDCKSFLLEIVPGAFDCYLLAGHGEISVFLEDFHGSADGFSGTPDHMRQFLEGGAIGDDEFPV